MARRRTLAALVATLALCVAFGAFSWAASPRPGNYSNAKYGITFKVVKTSAGKRIAQLFGGFKYKCNEIPLNLQQRIPVRGGRFFYEGQVDDVLGKPAGRLFFRGRFITRQKARGVFQVQKGNCDTGKTGFAALRSQQ